MADEVNSDAFAGGDTEASTKAAIEARNTTLQAQVDANTQAGSDRAEAEAGYLQAQADAEESALEADPGLLTGDPIMAQEEET